jgi:phospholipase D1/2
LIKKVDESDIQRDPKLSPGDLKRVGVHKIVELDEKKRHGMLEFFIEFIPTRMLSQSLAVPGIYFEETKGNEVKLYVNADDDGSAPVIKYGGKNDDEKVWTPPRLWRDIYDYFCNAKHFIYVAGWSVDTDQYLLRGKELEDALANGKYSPMIGELLKAKADEGVIVNLMQWDDYSSNFMLPGMMGTFDEKTRAYFRDTKVTSRFMSMIGGDVNTLFEGQSKKMAFTHHQKYIIMDAAKPDGQGRELFAFVGGIDLTLGRWDNRKHPLFRSLQSTHKGDTYTKCFKVSDECGPRQPWHDIHSAVRGPEAIHLALAFEERWTKQGNAGELVSRSRIGLDDETGLQNNGGWCAQISRSIDSRVNAFDPSVNRTRSNMDSYEEKAHWTSMKERHTSLSKRFATAFGSGFSYNNCLDRKKGRLVDNSIHLTNIHHIRRAKHFIYIESQYFMGSSFMWSKDSAVKCGNMIAAEVSLKICEKIAANEPFAVYILLPMWMEGIPAANATQGLLYYQRVTIEAMYQQVQRALDTRMANSSDHGLKVSDYLNFYCLGTRESPAGNEATGILQTSDEELLSKTRRHQIYIHSKFMVVDDEVALIGTANVNQRSMDGCRDSEIMMTSWQPDHVATDESIAKGDIHAFRLHAWASITGQMNEVFRNPSSPECVKTMNEIANKNWQTFLGDKTVDMESHLLPFVLEFEDGKIHPRKGLRGGNFPDTTASVLGKKSLVLPEIFLT